MKSQLKWLATATCAAAWSVCSYATVITVDNFAAVQSVTGDSGGTYAYFQFALNDSQMATSDGSTLADEVVVSEIAVGQRNGDSYSIADGSWLLIQEVNPLGGSHLGGTLGVTVAKTAPLTTEDKEPGVKVGTGDGKKTLTLCTWTLTTPVRLSKSKNYRATFYNASNAPANQQLEMVTIRNVTTGTSTKIHASDSSNFSPYVRVTVTDEVEPVAGVAKRATLTEDGTWSSLPWDPTDTPAIADTVTLSADAARTVTLTDDVTISGLTLSGTGPFSFAPASGQTPMLIAYATTADADTDVSAITAHLGAVTLASGKTLTMRDLVFSSITSDGGALCFKGGTVNSALLQTFKGSMTLRGGADVTLPNQYTMTSKQRFIADSGNATLKLYNNDAADGVVDLEGDETIQVKAGATLTLKARDLGGWSGYRGANLVVAVRGERAKITAGSYDSEPGCFAGRVVLADGGEIAGGSTATASLNFYGDTSTNAAYPEIYVSSGTGTWSGNLWRNKGIVVKVADGATFVLSGILKGNNAAALKKIGAGEMIISAAQTSSTGAYTVEAGTLTFSTKDALTLSNTISGAGTVKKSGAGTLKLTGTVSTPVELAEGTLDLGTQRPTIGGIADGATVKLTATEAELANRAITFSTTMGTAPAKERFTVVKPDGTTVLTLTAEPTVTDGTLTVPLPHTGGVITETGNWSTAGVSEETVVYVRGGESAETAITVTLDADLSTYTPHIVVIGHVKFVTTNTQSTLPARIALESGSVLTATASFAGPYTIPSGATLVLDGTTTAISSGNALTVNGTLKTQGTVTLSGANAVPAGGSLSVETGTLTLTASDQSLAGTINIAAGATLVNETGDALAYGGSPVVNVRGTLDMGSTRWTVGSRNTFNVYAGATIQGTGDGNGALDFYNGTNNDETLAVHTFNVPNEGDSTQPVTISAKLRLRQSGVTLKFNIELGNAKVNLTGENPNSNGKLEKAGAGSSRLILSGENKTYTGATTVTVGYLDLVGGCTLATSGVTVASGAAVTFQADDASTETTYAIPFALTGRMDKEGAHSVILSGTITGAGPVNVKNGGLTLDASAATAESPRAVANPITVGLDSGDAGTLTTKGYLTLSNESNKIAETGKLVVASDTTVLATAGGGNGIKGNLTIASNATLKCGTGDAPLYNGSQTFDISGTLELTGETRWTISSGATIKLHAGALLKGTGPASASGNFNCAFDFWQGGAITADGDATIEATLGNHNGGQTLTITQSAGTTTITGEVRNRLTLKAAGSGTVAYAPAAGVTATTSPLVVDAGATLQLTPNATFALNGAVSGKGKLVLGDGTTARTFTSTRTYPDVEELADLQSLTVQVKPRATLSLNPGAGNFAFPIATVFDVEEGAELILASGMSFFGVSGAGSCSVTGNYLFGVSGTAASAGFPDAAKVLNVATLTVGTDTNTAVTLSVRPFGAIAIAPTTLKVNKNAVIALDNSDSASLATADASVSLASSATVTGTGTISVPVTFANGAVLDTVTAAPLHLNGTVTGKIKVKLASGIEKTKEILITAPSVKLDRVTQLAFADDDTSRQYKTANFCFVESIFESRRIFTVSAPLTLASLPASVTGSEVARNAIYAAVNHIRDSDDPVTTITKIEAKSTNGNVLKTSSADALALFENLTAWAEPITGEGAVAGAGKVVVMYDFGISQLHVKRAALDGEENAPLYVLLCAKVATVEGDGVVPADYAAGTTITLYQGVTPLSALEPTDEQLQDLGLTRKAGEKWFAVPMKNLDTGTNAFTVSASQTPPTP